MSTDDNIKEEEIDPNVDKIEPSKLPKPYIEIFSTHPDAFDGYFDKKSEKIFPEIEDEDSVYESMGATISQTETFYRVKQNHNKKEDMSKPLELDNYLSSRRLEEQYQDIETFADEYLEAKGAKK